MRACFLSLARVNLDQTCRTCIEWRQTGRMFCLWRTRTNTSDHLQGSWLTYSSSREKQPGSSHHCLKGKAYYYPFNFDDKPSDRERVSKADNTLWWVLKAKKKKKKKKKKKIFQPKPEFHCQSRITKAIAGIAKPGRLFG